MAAWLLALATAAILYHFVEARFLRIKDQPEEELRRHAGELADADRRKDAEAHSGNVDGKSVDLLQGSQIDYVESLQGAGFQVALGPLLALQAGGRRDTTAGRHPCRPPAPPTRSRRRIS